MISTEKIPRCLKAFYVLAVYEVLISPLVYRCLGMYESIRTLPEELWFAKVFVWLLAVAYGLWFLFISVMLWGRRGWVRWLFLIGVVVTGLSGLPMLVGGTALECTMFSFSVFLSIVECVLVFSPSVSEYCRGRRSW